MITTRLDDIQGSPTHDRAPRHADPAAPGVRSPAAAGCRCNHASREVKAPRRPGHRPARLAVAAFVALALAADADAAPPFAVTVVDEATGRGVPLIELRTVNEARYVTDSAGVAAVDEPGLAGDTLFFHVKGHGYEFPADGFGYRGKALTVRPGGAETLRVRRLNVAERLYRVTGAGIYRDSALTGRQPPTALPLLNARVFGSDSVQTALYRGKLYWFWGDTNRPDYPLGNFHTPGATSDLPGRGGLPPETGVDLHYFEGPNGFAAETARLPGAGPTWVGGLAAFTGPDGRERLVTGYVKIKPPLEVYEHGLAEFDPETRRFAKVAAFPLDSAAKIGGHTFLKQDKGQTYVHYADPFPLTRVRADPAAMADVSNYESFTCRAGPRPSDPVVERDGTGRPRYAWKRNAPALQPEALSKLVRAGTLKDDEAGPTLRDVETGKAVIAHRGSVNWNDHRKRWVLIAVEIGGSASLLGEVWYAEAPTPLGPWGFARKVVTHDRYSFYNPKQHPEFDQDGGRTIYFEGTYTASFSGNPDPTPRYDYNQVMYRLDLADPRLNLPAPVTRLDSGAHAVMAGGHRFGARPAFFALDRPGPGTVPLFETPAPGGGFAFASEGESPLFHALAPETQPPPPGTTGLKGPDGRVLGLVWTTPPGAAAFVAP